jgi:hypothetical protein
VLAFARIGLGLAGLLCLAIAAIFDLEFVGRHLAADGVVTPGQAAALPTARLALAGFGLLVLAIAAFLERILAAPWLDRFLSSRRRVEWTIFLAPLVILIALAGYKLLRGPGDPFYLLAVREDSLVEWLTALAFFAGVVASCLLVRAMHLARRPILSAYYALLALFCLFVGLEEISYGQRLIGFATPQPVAARNVQNDMTIHNMDVMLALFFVLGPLILGAFGMLGFILSGLRRWIDPRVAQVLGFMVPPWFLASWFVPTGLFAAYGALAWGQAPLVEWQDQEPIEALVALGFVGFLMYNLARLRSGHPLAEAQPANPGDRR